MELLLKESVAAISFSPSHHENQTTTNPIPKNQHQHNLHLPPFPRGQLGQGIYHVAIEPEGEGYIVTYDYGRRDATLTTGRKTQHIVTLPEANRIHDQLIRQKTAKGYRPTGKSRQPDRTSTTDGQNSGIRCQLLNTVDESELDRLLGSDAICLQEKFDGRRLMVRKRGDEITGINRRSLLVPIPEAIRHAFEELPVDVLIDGEAVGDTLHAFGLLEVKGPDIRGNLPLPVRRAAHPPRS